MVSTRRLIVAYAALLALMDLAVLLPGRLEYSSGWGVLVPFAIQTLIVWRLWHGSTLAWLFAVAFATLTPLMLLLAGGPFALDVFFVFCVSFAQAAILCTRPIRPWARGPALGRPA